MPALVLLGASGLLAPPFQFVHLVLVLYRREVVLLAVLVHLALLVLFLHYLAGRHVLGVPPMFV